MKIKPIKSFHFIKALCAIGIIIFHFSCHLKNTTFRPFFYFENGNWGSTFVTIFFIVSGALLYHNYSDKMDIKTYYKKRWKSIFPMFYLAYLSFEIGNIFLNKSVLYRGSIKPYIFSIIGMDGYLSDNFTTYYNIGEWFLGMIIILYIIFPLILVLFKKNSNLIFISSLIFYLIFLDKPFINNTPFRTLPSCLISFILGMIIIKNKDKIINKWSTLAAILSCLLLHFIKLPISDDIGNHLMGLFVFVIMSFIGEWIMKNNICEKIFTELSKISYAIFLLQHLAIVKVLNTWNPYSPIKVLILLAATIILVICEAKMLSLVTNSVVKKSEQIICKTKKDIRKI